MRESVQTIRMWRLMPATCSGRTIMTRWRASATMRRTTWSYGDPPELGALEPRRSKQDHLRVAPGGLGEDRLGRVAGAKVGREDADAVALADRAARRGQALDDVARGRRCSMSISSPSGISVNASSTSDARRSAASCAATSTTIGRDARPRSVLTGISIVWYSTSIPGPVRVGDLAARALVEARARAARR